MTVALLIAGLLLLGLPGAPSVQASAQDAEDRREAAAEVREATEAFRQVMQARSIPASVLRRAVAVGVFSNVVQAAFLVGGQGGDGVIAGRTAKGWGPPAFFKLGGASVGAQIGGTKTDLVLVFTSQKAVDALLDDRLEVGTEVSAVAGPEEAVAEEASRSLRDEILVYSRHKGLFAGAALKGAIITPDNGLNRKTYSLTAREILSGKAPASLSPGLDMLGEELSKFKPATSS